MAIPPPSPDAAADGSDGEARSLLPADALPERYRVERQAGSAPGGTRLVATDTETGERVFVKRALDPEAIRREAEIVATLDHPGIIRLRDWRAEAEAAYLVLDFVDGPDLEAFLRRQGGCLAATTLVELLLKLADGVAAIHAGNVIHRDLKPANIIVGKGETPVIVDFGAAAAMKEIGIASATSLVTGG